MTVMDQIAFIEEKIFSLSEQVKKIKQDSLSPKTEFEVRKWYKLKRDKNVVCFYKENGNGCGVSDSGDWSESIYMSKNVDFWDLMTESEVKEALIKEAEKRGFKGGIKINSQGSVFNLNSGNDYAYRTESYHGHDTLYLNSGQIYCKGKWATIVKEEAIKIGVSPNGGYEVKFHDTDTFGLGYTTIDGHKFTYSFWIAAKEIAVNSKAKIMIGCSKQFDVSLHTINAILEKLKQ